MNTDKCNLHLLPINHICASEKCSIIMCVSCFSKHQLESKHPESVKLNQSTITFFISFNEYILRTLQGLIANIRSLGVNSVFKVIGGIPNYWDLKIILSEIERIVIEVINNFKNLTQNNLKYVSQNRQNYRGLLHPSFLKDIYSLVKENWRKDAQRIAEDIKQGLIANFPARYIYKRIRFQLNQPILIDIQFQKKKSLTQNPQKFIQEKAKQPSKLGDLEISKVESIIQKKIGNSYDQKRNSRLSHVDSFYEVLQNSGAQIEYNEFSINEVLEQNLPQKISPNFLSYQDLQKQIEELLIQNEKLRQRNFHLAEQNYILKKQNSELKFKKTF